MIEHIAFVAFGGNVGDPRATLQKAIPLVADSIGPVSMLSSLYETKALTLNSAPQSNYLNAVFAVVTKLEPSEILRGLLLIEHTLGRDRSSDKRWEPRTIDLDLLFVGDRVESSEFLTLPHPELAKRDFVLLPLAEIAPHFIHPTLQQPISALVARLKERSAEEFVLRRVDSSAAT
jgi:2-amino-4-hydroxy-6-hydroxymethyldihydropteridine diphosphokinase